MVASKKILVVDDDATVLNEVSEILEDEGFELIQGTDGQQALAMVRDEAPDLVVMDVEMPVMGGHETCRIIKANDKFGFIPIILVTARDDIHTKVESLELGADDYLIKPLNRPELVARVKSMLRLKTLQDDLIDANQKLKHFNERLQELSMTDALMGICNRLFFQKRVGYEFQRASRYKTSLALLMIDLDHFKRVNDTHGHPFGDHVLIKTAELFEKCVRNVDIVARYGGEELVVALPETNVAQAKIVAERIRSNMEKTEFIQGDIKMNVTVSIGIAVFPDARIKDIEDLLKLADEALYKAKQDGRNCIKVA